MIHDADWADPSEFEGWSRDAHEDALAAGFEVDYDGDYRYRNPAGEHARDGWLWNPQDYPAHHGYWRFSNGNGALNRDFPTLREALTYALLMGIV